MRGQIQVTLMRNKLATSHAAYEQRASRLGLAVFLHGVLVSRKRHGDVTVNSLVLVASFLALPRSAYFSPVLRDVKGQRVARLDRRGRVAQREKRTRNVLDIVEISRHVYRRIFGGSTGLAGENRNWEWQGV